MIAQLLIVKNDKLEVQEQAVSYYCVKSKIWPNIFCFAQKSALIATVTVLIAFPISLYQIYVVQNCKF